MRLRRPQRRLEAASAHTAPAGIDMWRVRIALAGGIAILLVAICVTLSGAPIGAADTGGVPTGQELAYLRGHATICQSGETMLAGTTAIRMSLFAVFGPRLSVRAYSNGHLVTSGVRGSGWVGETPTIPVAQVNREVTGAKICATLGKTDEAVTVGGKKGATPYATSSVAGQKIPGRMSIEYARRVDESWWSTIGAIAAQLGIGRWPSGGGLAVLLLLLMGSMLAAACWLALRELNTPATGGGEEGDRR